MKKAWIVILLYILIPSTEASAGAEGYICISKIDYDLTSDGALKQKPTVPVLFHIDRTTGKVDGGMFASTWNLRSTILTTGGKNAVFALSIDFGQGDVALVIVKEYADGPYKPFVASTALGTYSGVCE